MKIPYRPYPHRPANHPIPQDDGEPTGRRPAFNYMGQFRGFRSTPGSVQSDRNVSTGIRPDGNSGFSKEEDWADFFKGNSPTGVRYGYQANNQAVADAANADQPDGSGPSAGDVQQIGSRLDNQGWQTGGKETAAGIFKQYATPGSGAFFTGAETPVGRSIYSSGYKSTGEGDVNGPTRFINYDQSGQETQAGPNTDVPNTDTPATPDAAGYLSNVIDSTQNWMQQNFGDQYG